MKVLNNFINNKSIRLYVQFHKCYSTIVDDYDNSGYTLQRFADKVQIEVKAGKGGNGCVSHEITSPGCKKPSGGSGGKGGNVFIQGDAQLYSLKFQTYHFNAGDGRHGGSAGLTGKSGDDIYIKVPLGTIVTEKLSNDYEFDDEDENNSIDPSFYTKEPAYIDDETTLLLVAKGGLQGQGNQFAMKRSKGSRSKIKSMPSTYLPGQNGEARSLQLELKIIADVGLCGFPNAGKSSLLRVLSNAEPKVAAYPFTTLHPSIGMVEYSDYERISVADIPGLIEGAHENKGLGHDFLRHIERTKLILYVLDGSYSASLDDKRRSPLHDLKCLMEELRLYDKELLKKPAIIYCNKVDLESHPDMSMSSKKLLNFTNKLRIEVFTGSAHTGVGIPQLARRLREKLQEKKKKSQFYNTITDNNNNNNENNNLHNLASSTTTTTTSIDHGAINSVTMNQTTIISSTDNIKKCLIKGRKNPINRLLTKIRNTHNLN